MKYDLIFCDYDHTLYGDRDDISDVTKQAIKDYVAAGGKFVICTGRPYIAVGQRAKDLGLDGYIITAQGASINDLSNDSKIYEEPIDKITALKLLNHANNNDLYIHLFNKNRILIDKESEISKLYEQLFHIEATLTDKPLMEYIGIEDICPTKAEIIVNGDLNQVLEELYYKFGDVLKFTESHDILIEIISKKANKGEAADFVAKTLGIERDRIMAIGDGNNDIDMIQYAGLGVAMGNATDGLKECADYITLSNYEDGVAEVIRKFCLDA